MPKTRIEALSDGVFAIVLTLLIIEIKVPELHLDHAISDLELFSELTRLIPLFLAYFVSFAVISTFWVFHNFFYSVFAKTTDRILTQLNILFLSVIAFIPFSAHLIGIYPNNKLAVIWYGSNVLIVALVARAMLSWALKSKNIENETEIKFADITFQRLYNQASVRGWINVTSAVLGITFAFIFIPLSYICFAFPVVFNTVPGLLNKVEKLFGLKF